MRRVALVVLALSALPAGPVTAAAAAAAPAAAPAPLLQLGKAWVRRNPVPGRPSAGYVAITNHGPADRVVAASAPGVRIEMHSMSMTGGVMAMARLDALPVPMHSNGGFAPGGNHLMIFGLPAAARALPITLAFASGARLTVSADVRAADAAAPAAMPAMDHGRH